MSQKTIFARARPRALTVTETYPHKTEISSSSHTHPDGDRTGLVEIVVPYDGRKNLSPQAFEDIKKQEKRIKGQDEARIGHVSFSDYARTNLDAKLNLSTRHNVLPLNIKFRGNGLEHLDDLRSDSHVCRLATNYTPDKPKIDPIDIQVRVYDETEVKEQDDVFEEQRNYKQGQIAALDPEKIVAEQISKHTGFERSLIFDFSLTLRLPDYMGPARGSRLPIVRRMALEWPVATSHRLVHLTVIGSRKSNRTVTYNPEQKVIEWSNIPFESYHFSDSEKTYLYRSPLIRLSVDEPGELYQLRELTGSVQVEIGQSYSGVRLAFLDVSGKHDDKLNIKYRTVLTSELRLDLHDCFEQKIYSPYQHLQFPNVILNEMRRADIMNLLKDAHFTCLYDEPKELSKDADSGKRRYLIWAVRPEGVGTLTLWIVLRGTPSNTKRERKIPGEEVFTTSFQTGNTDIYIRGQLRSDSRRVVEVINEIHERLKERFRHVSVLD